MSTLLYTEVPVGASTLLALASAQRKVRLANQLAFVA